MDDHTEHRVSTMEESGDEAGLAWRPSDIEASSGPRAPGEPAEQEPRPETEEEGEGEEEKEEEEEEEDKEKEKEAAEAPERGAPVDEQAEAAEGPEAPEAAGEEGPLEPGRLSTVGAEEPAKRASEARPEAAEEEEAAAAAAGEERRAPSRASLRASTASEAAPGPPAEAATAQAEAAAQERAGDYEDLEWSAEVQQQQERQLRSELLEQYRALLAERGRYQRCNLHLQHRIAEALRRKKGLEAGEAPDRAAEAEAPEKEQAYVRHLAVLEELRKQEADDLEWYHQELAQLQRQAGERLARAEREWRRFQALKRQVVLQAMGSGRLRGGRQAAVREVEQLQALEERKEREMRAVRLENVQLRQSLAHFETRMRAQESLADGLLLIDFEQLKIENQTFSEKVEERSEELLRLQGKVTSHVQVITHVREKLHFVDTENACKKAQLLEIEAQVAQGRDVLTRTKQARDSLRVDNVKLSQRCGLLGKEALLRDLEEKVDRTAALTQRLEALQRHHAGLLLSCKGVKQKIREAKAFLPS
ncbi:cilia- and flagella-associated protein 184 [Oryctolagus cuniculus]|uniref:cilia- and flagella-associated protein 184 n=1 Tax=Oryctolagus cuniculus TaxID=9986 RepID=UPI0038794842